MNNSISLRKRLGLELFRQKEQLIRQKHELHTLFLECTLRCNLACRHCGSDCKAISGNPICQKRRLLKGFGQHYSTQVDPHRVFIIFTGGEPLMRKDLEECGRACYRREYPWGLVTNGLLLSRQRLDRLFTSRPAQHYRKSGRTGRCPQLVTPTSGKLSPGQSGYRNAEPGKKKSYGMSSVVSINKTSILSPFSKNI